MSAQPIPIAKQPPSKEEAAKAQRRASFRDDAMYIAGAVLVTVGAGMVRPWAAFFAAGVFLLLIPVLQLVTGFIRGLRAK